MSVFIHGARDRAGLPRPGCRRLPGRMESITESSCRRRTLTRTLSRSTYWLRFAGDKYRAPCIEEDAWGSLFIGARHAASRGEAALRHEAAQRPIVLDTCRQRRCPAAEMS